MSDETAALSRSYPVGPRFRATFTATRLKAGIPPRLVIEWAPRQPRRMSDQELSAYRVARDSFLAELMKVSGVDGAVAVLELK